MVSFTHEQIIICSQTQLDNIVHEQTIICRQVIFSSHASNDYSNNYISIHMEVGLCSCIWGGGGL